MQERIQEALRRDAVDEALALAQDWVAQAPDDARAQRILSAVLARSGDPAAALVALDQAMLLAPEDAGLHFERALLLLRTSDPGAAGEALGQSLGLDPNHLPSYLAQAHMALARDDLDEAERISRTAARIDADDPRLVALDALVALRRGNTDHALALASAASVQLRDDPQLLSTLGFGYLAKRHWAFAEQAFRRTAELLPDARALQPVLAQLAAAQGRPDEAVDLLVPLLEDPATDTAALRRSAGLFALQAGRGEQAMSLLRRSLAQQPDDRVVLGGLLALWRERGDRDDAVATLEAALATSREVGDLWAARLALEPAGTAEGERVLERWLQAMPEHVPALETALFARDRAGDREGVERCARRLLELQAGHPAAEQFLVESLFVDDPDAALARVRAMLVRPSAEGGQAAVRSWLGHLLDRAGRPAEALAEWQSLHGDFRTGRLPLPEYVGLGADGWPILATPASAESRPLLVWGLPGSGIERVVETLAGAGGPVRHDRFGSAPPADPLQSPLAARALRDGQLDPAALVAQWREQLPLRGVDDGNVVDWLPWWDNALLLALCPHLPEGLLLTTLRDPRDMLLDWLATGSPVPLALESPAAAADWLAQGLEQVAELHEQSPYPHLLLRVDDVLDSPPALAALVGQALGIQLPLPAPVPRRLPPGRWRAYAEVLAVPFARLAPVAARLGYPEA
ncbi:tetratricopeptide repeat protein [Pseudoxanthomonas suwonensis]|uniref:Uncharacterized protein n=1 Tax=Pseudoxanthomonas suwonensis TaxID=314722 RepID=A0A0E3Z189_9GAMM|nr:tetratricopeptide repeat protein [Pseudoxanthomonas suwonensis]AKC86628.1 hypothetical protein WQ53_07450 [Pseudoxanthomonas suwonensis]